MVGSSDSRSQGPAAVFDRAVHLFGLAPSFWLGRGLLPSVPFALGVFAAVYLYGAVWSYEAWDLSLLLRSVALSGGLVLAWALRGFAQAALFQEAFAQAEASMSLVGSDRDGGDVLSRRRSSAAGILSLGGSLMLLPVCGLPGVIFGASTLMLAPLIAAERRDLGSALRRTLRLARQHPLRGVANLSFFGLVHFLVWLSVLLSCRGGVVLISALFGVDLSMAELVFSPANVPFLLGSGICAWLLLEPLWVLQRSLLYLDSVLGVSGADLRDAWESIKSVAEHPPAPGGSVEGGRPGASLATAFAALSLVFFCGPAHAETLAEEPTAEASLREQLITYAVGMEALAEAVVALTPSDRPPSLPGDGSEAPIDGEALRALLADEGVLSVVLSGGVEVRLDPRAAVSPSAKGVPPDLSQASAEGLAERFREAGAFARGLANPDEPTAGLRLSGASATSDVAGAGEPTSPLARDLGAMLAQELRRDEYSLAVRQREHRTEKTRLSDRLFEWLEDWFEGHEQEESTPHQGPPIRLPTKTVVVSALMLFAVLAVGWGWAARGRGHGDLRPSEATRTKIGESTLPDARSRTVESWRALAERSALSGDHREAIRSLFLGVLAMLEGLREIEYRPSSSNGEHLTTFSGTPSRRDNFALAVLSFELAWFGGQGAQAVDWERMLRLCDPLLRPGDLVPGSDG